MIEPSTLTNRDGGQDLLTPKEVAERWRVHQNTVYGYVRSGKLPAMRLPGGHGWRIRREDAELLRWGQAV